LIALTGCEDNDNPSTIYPEQLIFQNIDITVTNNSINATSAYFSNDVIYFSSLDEKQLLSINRNQQFSLNIKRSQASEYSPIDYTTYISEEQLSSSLQAGDELTVIFNRSTGSVLESSAQVPRFARFLAPFTEQVIDHSTTDLSIEWDLAASESSKLYLRGECLSQPFTVGNNEFSVLPYDLTEGQTSLLIPMNTIDKAYGFDSENCSVSAHLYQQNTGIIDPNFAGGRYNIKSDSSISFTLTNLKDTNND
tara:strand:- start:606 stop:1358 length:753 start_codon:yes stop_codon:yes gene_type:complete